MLDSIKLPIDEKLWRTFGRIKPHLIVFGVFSHDESLPYFLPLFSKEDIPQWETAKGPSYSVYSRLPSQNAPRDTFGHRRSSNFREFRGREDCLVFNAVTLSFSLEPQTKKNFIDSSQSQHDYCNIAQSPPRISFVLSLRIITACRQLALWWWVSRCFDVL